MSPEAEELYNGFVKKGRTEEESKQMALESVKIVIHELMKQPNTEKTQEIFGQLIEIQKEIEEL